MDRARRALDGGRGREQRRDDTQAQHRAEIDAVCRPGARILTQAQPTRVYWFNQRHHATEYGTQHHERSHKHTLLLETPAREGGDFGSARRCTINSTSIAQRYRRALPPDDRRPALIATDWPRQATAPELRRYLLRALAARGVQTAPLEHLSITTLADYARELERERPPRRRRSRRQP
jgi:hypothetical protein